MPDKKTRKQFEEWAKKRIKHYQDVLLLSDRIIFLEYDEDTGFMSCSFRYPYKDATIEYSDSVLAAWAAKDFDYLNRTLIHEMFHIITDPLYAKSLNRFGTQGEIEDEREHLTDHLANVIFKLKV